MTPTALWLWLCAAALTSAGAAGQRACAQLRVPPTRVAHELVHLSSFENVHTQAARLAAGWQLPAYKTADVARQLLDAFEDMATQRASEALVNISRDYALAYEVTVASLAAPSAAYVEQTIVVAPERPFDDTVRAFCARYEVDECEELQEKLYPLVVRDWGCLLEAEEEKKKKTEDEEEHGGDHEEEEDYEFYAYADSSSTKRQAVLAPAAPATDEDVAPASPRTEGSGHTPSLPVLAVQSDGVPHNVTLRADLDLELQAAVLCRHLKTPASECARVLDAMRALTKDHAAFLSDDRAHTPLSASGLVLQLFSPPASRWHPISERVYFDGAWLRNGAPLPADHRRTVCVYYYGIWDKQQICGPFPPEEIWYFQRHALREGHHIVVFTEAPNDDDKEDEGAKTQLLPAPSPFLAARHFWAVAPRVRLVDVRLRTVAAHALVVLTIETTAFDLADPEFRVCALLDGDALECFRPERLHVESQSAASEPPTQRRTVFRAALFGVQDGAHDISLLLVNSYNSAIAHSDIVRVPVRVPAETPLAPRDASHFFEPASARHIQRPTHCPPRLAAARLRWVCELWRYEWGRFSQNGEDGVLQSIFHHVGAGAKYYVEFGTEDARECNTRLLREQHAWHGLLLDGSHANAAINLHTAWISPENINELFAEHGVPREIDLLSVDVDFNDYWILDAIDRARFSPRVIVIEINSHVPPSEPRVVKYAGPAAHWDGESAYFGVGVGAIHLWGTRHGYSLVYCESHGVNCFLVRDDVLAAAASDDESGAIVVSEELSAADLHAPPNFFGRNISYPPPPRDSGIVEDWVWLDRE